MDDFLFMIFACEEQKKEDYITLLSKEPDPNDPYTQAAIASQVGLDWDSLSDYDKNYIEGEVFRRWAM